MEMESSGVVSDKEKDICAITTVRRMVEIYAEEKKIPYDEAFYEFAASRTYKAIFDFETGIWREGAYYFLSLYKEELAEKSTE